MAEEGSLLRGCTAGARAWESSPGLQGPRVRGQREMHTNTCKHTHTYSGSIMGSESSRAKLKECRSKTAGSEQSEESSVSANTHPSQAAQAPRHSPPRKCAEWFSLSFRSSSALLPPEAFPDHQSKLVYLLSALPLIRLGDPKRS